MHSKEWEPSGQSMTFNPVVQEQPGPPESFRQHHSQTQRNLLALPWETLLEQLQQSHERYCLGPSLGLSEPIDIASGNPPSLRGFHSSLGCLRVAKGHLSDLL